MDALLLAVVAQAATLWHCALSPDLVRLECVAETIVPAASAPTPTASVRGTPFPLDPARRWVVDLWSPPSDAERVTQLARATICFRSPGCAVQLTLPAALVAAR
ncbi:MAG TPA: hypothetical protein VFQ20_07110 [Burkholderiaceae bacterium]|nr:hypothetical protein [Burkholderiaceae bacterium]